MYLDMVLNCNRIHQKIVSVSNHILIPHRELVFFLSLSRNSVGRTEIENKKWEQTTLQFIDTIYSAINTRLPQREVNKRLFKLMNFATIYYYFASHHFCRRSDAVSS